MARAAQPVRPAPPAITGPSGPSGTTGPTGPTGPFGLDTIFVAQGNTGTTFMPLDGSPAGPLARAEIYNNSTVSVAGTIRNLYVNSNYFGLQPSGNQSLTVTLYVNGSPTVPALTCTVSVSLRTCSDTTDTVPVIAGQEVDYYVSAGGSFTSLNTHIAVSSEEITAS